MTTHAQNMLNFLSRSWINVPCQYPEIHLIAAFISVVQSNFMGSSFI